MGARKGVQAGDLDVRLGNLRVLGVGLDERVERFAGLQDVAVPPGILGLPAGLLDLVLRDLKEDERGLVGRKEAGLVPQFVEALGGQIDHPVLAELAHQVERGIGLEGFVLGLDDLRFRLVGLDLLGQVLLGSLFLGRLGLGSLLLRRIFLGWVLLGVFLSERGGKEDETNRDTETSHVETPTEAGRGIDSG